MQNVFTHRNFILRLKSGIVSKLYWRKHLLPGAWFQQAGDGKNHDETELQKKACIITKMILFSNLIIIENAGRSEARNVRIALDGIPLEHYPGIINGKEHYTIGPLDSIMLQTGVDSEDFPSDSIEISWDDDQASDKTYRNTLSF